ncbi:MAG: hypothetical protein ABIP48_02355, partial [Planctomycetota bacterium]
MVGSCLVMLLSAACAFEQGESIVENGGFEKFSEVRVGADGLVQGWRLAEPPRIPTAWSLNTAYPGQLALLGSEADKAGAHGGQHFVRIAADDRTAHLYQMCRGLESGKWYRVSAWVRGGAVSLGFYEYFQSGKIGGQTVAQSTAAGGDWKLIEGFYRPPADGYLRSAAALTVPPGQSADVDDVSIEPIVLPEAPAGAADVVLETDAVRLTISPQGVLREFRSKASGKDYAVEGTPFPILHLVRRGVPTPVHSITREGDLLRARFLDADLKASLRVVVRKRH